MCKRFIHFFEGTAQALTAEGLRKIRIFYGLEKPGELAVRHLYITQQRDELIDNGGGNQHEGGVKGGLPGQVYEQPQCQSERLPAGRQGVEDNVGTGFDEGYVTPSGVEGWTLH